MRLTTWNCPSGADIERCLAETDALRSDLLTIQQCRKPSTRQPHVIWRGGTVVQGIAMISRTPGLALTALALPSLHHNVVPVLVHAAQPFLLVGVWTQGSYNAVVRTALTACLAAVANVPIVVAGAFYAAPPLDGQRRSVALMREMRQRFGLVSAYHSHAGLNPETDARTPAHLWREDEPFHLNYCFVSEGWARHVRAVDIASARIGRASEHRPLTVTLEP